jgi:hypothetical protein
MKNELTAELFATLHDLTGSVATIDEDGPDGLVGVWVDDEIIGSGECTSEALEDAIHTARGWS